MATLNRHTVSRAYGDCKSVREVVEALSDQKDFRIRSMHHPDDGRVFNLRQLGPETTHLTVRYKRDTMVCTVAIQYRADGRMAAIKSGRHARPVENR